VKSELNGQKKSCPLIPKERVASDHPFKRKKNLWKNIVHTFHKRMCVNKKENKIIHSFQRKEGWRTPKIYSL
jgi:hypothetical protein